MQTRFTGLIAATLLALSGSAYAIQSDVASGITSTLFIQNGSLYCAGSITRAVCGDGGDYLTAEEKQFLIDNPWKSTGPGTSYMDATYLEGIDNVATVDAIQLKSAWLTDDGRVYWMGLDHNYQKNPTPTEIVGLAGASDFTLMGAQGNGDHAFAIINGQAFVYDFTNDSVSQVEGLPNDVVAVDADSSHALFLTATGELYAAGDNTYGQLGAGDFVSTDVTYAVQVLNADYEPLIGVQKISAGHDLSMAVVDGIPYAWGRNRQGALGVNSLDETITREYAGAVTNFEGSAVNVSTNGATLIHGADGNLYGMGWHNATSLRNATPTLLVNGGIEELYVNNGDVWFVRHDGEIKGWGGSLYGQQAYGSQTETHTLTTANFVGEPTVAEPEVIYVDVEVEKIVYVEVEVPVEVIKEVEVVKEVVKTVEVPVEVVKEVIVEVPVEVIKEVVKEVIKTVEVVKEVPVEKIVYQTVEVPVEVIKTVEVVKTVEVPADCNCKTKKAKKAKKAKGDKRGYGYGDKNHTHTGPKGQNDKAKKAKCKTKK